MYLIVRPYRDSSSTKTRTCFSYLLRRPDPFVLIIWVSILITESPRNFPTSSWCVVPCGVTFVLLQHPHVYYPLHMIFPTQLQALRICRYSSRHAYHLQYLQPRLASMSGAEMPYNYCTMRKEYQILASCYCCSSNIRQQENVSN
ncbi:hypothetical protein K445DRAFT_201630 [Daldinia sp. EC12]|nr:hypothetical protein F4774DRAFT_316975 [Daldinia eschscholtzii]OTB12121.1 hypothetical protein K445DRAFT_201630 [Daldinia sp. EC12]